ncbi:MAG: hypothetical protein ACJ74Y_00040 [Bryobacteraceae bacterium]
MLKNKPLPSWREKVRYRALLAALVWFSAGALLFYLGARLPKDTWYRPLTQSVGGTCLSIVLVTIATYLFGDRIAQDILYLFQKALSTKQFLGHLDRSAKFRITHNLLNDMIGWCADPVFDFINVASTEPKEHRSRLQPRHEWDLTNYIADLECKFTGDPLTLRRDDYFRVVLHDEFLTPAESFGKDLLSTFFFEDSQKGQDELRRAFLESDPLGKIIFRDVLFWSERDIVKLKGLLGSPAQKAGSPSDSPLFHAIKAKLKVHIPVDRDNPATTAWSIKEINPDRVAAEPFDTATGRPGSFRLIWSKAQLPSDLLNLPKNTQVRVEMFIEFPILKSVGFYPIIFQSFAKNPEIIVSFRTTDALSVKDVVPYLVAADPKQFELSESEDGSRIRLSAGDAFRGTGAWLFPGSGVAIRWRLAPSLTAAGL